MALHRETFGYLKPTDTQQDVMAEMRHAAAEYARLIDEYARLIEIMSGWIRR